jgi:hypothetical protein
VANLQVKGIDDAFYADLKRLAADKHRSVSQQVVVMLKDYLAKRPHLTRVRLPAQVLLDLAGTWEDDCSPDEIVQHLRTARRSSAKLTDGF